MIDLNTCKPGDKLKTKHGTILIYVQKLSNSNYGHLIQYPNGGHGTRTDDGFTYIKKRLPGDEDIIEILGQ